MEEQFITAWLAAREKAAAIGVRLRPLERDKAMQLAHRSLQATGRARALAPWPTRSIWS